MQKLRRLGGPGWAVAIALAPALFCGGCFVGQGEGWVTGAISVVNCEDGQALNAPSFDLQIDFFAAEPSTDSNDSVSQRRNRLDLRLQDTSNNIEETNGLVLQLLNTESAARLFVASQPLPVTNNGLCALPCAQKDDLVRGRMYIFSRCPDCRQPLVATGQAMAASTPGGCLLPSGVEQPACRTLSSSDQAELDALCAGDFRDRSSAPRLRSILGDGACLYLCRFGQARRGQDPASLAGFTIDFGERVAGLLSLSIVDARSVASKTCAQASGQVQGMFSFDVTRGRPAQAFP